MRKLFYFLILGLALLAQVFFGKNDPSGKEVGRPGDQTYLALKKGFQNPSGTALPKVYWWWLNGNVDTSRLKQELQAIKEAGLGGVDIFEIGVPTYTNPRNMIPAGPAFMGEESKQAIKVAVREAAKLNLEVGFNLASSWNAGGSWTAPQHAAKSLYFSRTRLQGAGARKVLLPFPVIPRTDAKGKDRLIAYGEDNKPLYYEEVAVLALPAGLQQNRLDTSRVINVTAYFDAKTGALSWPAPAGDWELYRYVCANSGEELKLPSPNSRGPIIDHYDSAATRAHFQYFIDQLQPLIGAFGKTTLKNFYLASYEATGAVWTPSLPATFRKINGYDITKFLPALFDKEAFGLQQNEKLQSDFTRTLSELIINNHYRKAREISNHYGLKITSEAGGPGKPLHNVPVEALKALGSLDVPRGEFWNKHHFYDADSIDILWLVKEIAAAAHIYGRNIVEEEAFTSFQHWREGPGDLKPLADRAFAEGMNRVVVHGFSHNPAGTGYPGIVYHAGTHYNDKRVWWPKIRPFNQYLARISYILQQAGFASDVLYYYGDQVPNFVYPKNTRFSLGPGYDYEVINTEILLRDLKVQDGQLVLPNGARFSMLYLEPEKEMQAAVLRKLQDLVQQGARILGEKPDKVRGLPVREAAPSNYQHLIRQLWAPAGPQPAAIKGKIISGLAPRQMLEALHIAPDLDYDHQQGPVLDYTHYKHQDLDFYFIRNTTKEWVSRNCVFRQQNKTPEIWDPLSGKVIPVPVYHQQAGGISIPLTLAPEGAYFVVFNKGAAAARFSAIASQGQHPPLMEFTAAGIHFLEKGDFELSRGGKPLKVRPAIREQQIKGSWDLSFPQDKGAPARATFPELLSWTKAADPGIQYFSGIATYHKTFAFQGSVARGQRVYLDLGEVSKVAEVWLNGKRLGIAWSRPYRFEVSGLLQNGNNTLRVEVANTWSNRLTGDAITGEKYTSTNITNVEKVPWAKLPLLESGLLGPVRLQTISLVN